MRLPERILVLTGVVLLFACGAFASEPERETIRVGYWYLPGYHEQKTTGERSGYGYEYLQKIGACLGWDYEYVGYDIGWSELLDMLESGKIDLLTCATRTPERERRFDYSDSPIGLSFTNITVRAGDTRFHPDDYKNWNGIRVGMIQDSSRNVQFDELAKLKGFDYTPVVFQTYYEFEEALQNGTVDALVSTNSRKTRNEWIIDRIMPDPIYIIVRKGNRKLLDKINSALSSLEREMPQLGSILSERYYASEEAQEIPLTTAEREFADTSRRRNITFRALLNPDRFPMSYYINGEIKGIQRDIADMIVARSGLNIRIIPCRTRLEYNAVLNSGEFDLLFDARHDYALAEKHGLYIGEPYISYSLSLLRLKSHNGPVAKIAIPRSPYLKADMRLLKLDESSALVCETTADLVAAVKRGDVDAGYLLSRMCNEAIAREPSSELVSQLVFGRNFDYTVGVRRDLPVELLSILDKAGRSISRGEISKIIAGHESKINGEFSGWTWIKANPWTVFSATSTVLLMIIFLLMMLFFSYRKQFRNAQILKKLPVRFFVADRRERVLFFNAADLNSNERKWRCIADLAEPEVAAIMRRTVAAAFEKGSASVDYSGYSQKRSAIAMRLPDSVFRRESVVWISQNTEELQNSRERAASLAARLQLTLESIGDAVISTDHETKITFMNPVAEKLCGYSLSEAKGRRLSSIFQVVNYKTGLTVPSPVEHALSNGDVCSLADHTDLIAKDNTRRHIADSAAPIHDRNGEIIGAILVFRDVTEEYEKRDSLARALTTLEFASELTVSAAFEYDFHQNKLVGSKMLDKLWPQKDGVPIPRKEWILPEDLPAFNRAFQRLRRGEDSLANLDFRSKYYGELRYYRLKACMDASNPMRHQIVGVLRDTTEQTELSASEHLLSRCLEDFFTTSDYLASIRLLMKSAAQHMNASRCFLLKTDMSKQTSVLFAEFSVGESESWAAGQFDFHFELNWSGVQKLLRHEAVVLDDLSRPEQIEQLPTLRVLRDGRGIKSIYLTGVFLDGKLWGGIGLAFEKHHSGTFSALKLNFLQSAAHILELLLKREQLERELRTALDMARNAEKAKTFFLATMSHEIRTPLNAVIGFSELLKDATLPEPIRAEYLNDISTSGNALLALINDVLDLSKLEAKQMVFSPVPTDLAELVREMTVIFQSRIAAKKLRCVLKIQPMPVLIMDKLRIRQILFNLIGNAIKFTDSGTITIAGEFISKTETSGTLRFSVDDTGCGIPPEERERIFQPFVQSNALRGTQVANSGTGLGLAIVLRLLKCIHGEITLNSEVGIGSAFTVELHDVAVASPAEPSSRELPNHAAARMVSSVLLVDDIAINLKVMKAMCEKCGVPRVECALSGSEALALLEKEPVEVIFTDMWMPGMSGMELAKKIRSDKRFDSIGIFAVTADTEAGTNFDVSLFSGMLLKPVTMERITRALQNWEK